MTKRQAFFIFASLIALSGAAEAMPVAKQAADNQWKSCEAAVQAAEARAGIPKHLLGAISKAESGRWHPTEQANIAWPWTVTANGKGMFFDSKAEAMAEAEILITEGVRNLDVGCMQVNLMYHPGAFANLAQAFDPAANAEYGAKYLKSMHAKTRDWREAAAHYHSTTPAQAARYRAKVLKLWDEARKPHMVAMARPAPKKPEPKKKDETKDEADRARASAINYGMMQRLNAAFQERQEEKTEAEQLAEQEAKQAHLRREQLESWRENQVSGISLVHLANMRRAELAQRRRKELTRVSAEERADNFTERRRNQLDAWRAHRTNGDTIYYSGDTPLPFKLNAETGSGS
ncbi:MAG: transglycosylase SLT domain-containing protein [Rhodospirillaceae bacterium]